MIRRTSGRSGVLLDHPAHRKFYINKSEQECRAQGPPTQRHMTTTASCRSRNWPVVRASVGVSEVVRSTYCRPSKNHVTFRSGGRLASRPPKFLVPLFFLAPWAPTKKVPLFLTRGVVFSFRRMPSVGVGLIKHSITSNRLSGGTFISHFGRGAGKS